MRRYVLTARACSEAWKRTRATRSADKARHVRRSSARTCVDAVQDFAATARRGAVQACTLRATRALWRPLGRWLAQRAATGRAHPAPCSLATAPSRHTLVRFCFNMLMERSVHLATCRRSSRSTCTASLSSRRGSGVSHVSNVHRRAPGRPEPFVRRLPWPAAWRCAASFFAPPTACHVCHVRRVDGVWATRPPLCRRPKSTVS